MSASDSRVLFVFGDGGEDLAGDVVGGDAFALGGEVGDDAVAEDGQRNGRHVLNADVELAVEDGASLGGKDQVEARARAGTPGEPFLAEIQGLGRLRPRDGDELLGVS